MIILKGKYNEAKIFTDNVESSAQGQIITFLNDKTFENGNIRIMPDVHAGAGAVIGFTAPVGDRIIPNVIGVDIGCGVCAFKLGHRKDIGEKFDKLDKFIEKTIPHGMNVNGDYRDLAKSGYCGTKDEFDAFTAEVKEVCNRTEQNFTRVMCSLGSLGGGNHFIEIDKDDEGNLWLVVHSGSRNFGLQIAKYHQNKAKEYLDFMKSSENAKLVAEVKKTANKKEISGKIKKAKDEAKEKYGVHTGLEYLEGGGADQYKKDMDVAQRFASFNRLVMVGRIVEGFYGLKYSEMEVYHSIHNYINFEDGIVRKGAISAHCGEKVVIPLNMADGTIIGIGKGNEDWNNSAPHGAGRKMSRSKAKKSLDVDYFRKRMKQAGVWSSCVGKSTLDEAPMAYKKAQEIIDYLEPTVEIQCHMKPVYNFKAH